MLTKLNRQVAASAGSIPFAPFILKIHGLPYLAFPLLNGEIFTHSIIPGMDQRLSCLWRVFDIKEISKLSTARVFNYAGLKLLFRS